MSDQVSWQRIKTLRTIDEIRAAIHGDDQVICVAYASKRIVGAVCGTAGFNVYVDSAPSGINVAASEYEFVTARQTAIADHETVAGLIAALRRAEWLLNQAAAGSYRDIIDIRDALAKATGEAT